MNKGILATMILFIPFQLFADEPRLVYSVEKAKNSRPDSIQVLAKLRNAGDRSTRVYWGDRAWHEMYQFEIRKDTGQRIPTFRSSASVVEFMPQIVDKKHFREIKPGEELTYSIFLSPSGFGSNSQIAMFREHGNYTINPKFISKVAAQIDRKTGTVSKVSSAWVGELDAPAINVKISQKLIDASNARNRNSLATQHEKTIELSGNVLASDGTPAPNAIVQVRYSKTADGKYSWRHSVPLDAVLTNQAGEFSIPSVPDECDYWFEAFSQDSEKGFQTYNYDSFEASKPLVIRFLEMKTVSGKVVDVDGNARPGVRVNQRTYTDANGLFSDRLTKFSDAKDFSVSLWQPGWVGQNKKFSWELADKSNLRLTMRREDSLRCTGVAKFVDGSTIDNAALSFELFPREDERRSKTPFRTQTVRANSGGTFSLTLPDKRTYEARVFCMDRESGLKRWLCNTVIKAGDDTLLEFDNRGKLLVRLFADSRQLLEKGATLRCISTQDKRAVVRAKLAPGTTRYAVENLSPGEYQLQLDLADYDFREDWAVTAVVPDEPPHTGFCVLRIPRVQFGGVKGCVLLPDGKTPAVGFIVNAGGNWRTQARVKTDKDGRFSISDLSVGKGWLRVSAQNGLRQMDTRAFESLANKIQDIGDVILKRDRDEFGSFEGQLTDREGNPIAGTTLLGVFKQVSAVNQGFLSLSTHGDSSLIPKGIGYAIFDLHGTAQARNVISGSFDFRPEILKSTIARVEITPGKTLVKSFVLEEISEKSNITIDWSKTTKPTFMLALQHGDLIHTWESNDQGIIFLDTEGNPKKEPQVIQLKRIPKVASKLFVYYVSEGKFHTIDLPAERPEVVKLAQPSSSKLEISVKHKESGKAIEHFYASVFARAYDLDILVLQIPYRVPGLIGLPILSGHKGMHQWTEAGNLVLRGLSPGTYKLKVANHQISNPWEGTVELEVGETEVQSFSLLLDAEGTLSIEE